MSRVMLGAFNSRRSRIRSAVSNSTRLVLLVGVSFHFKLLNVKKSDYSAYGFFSITNHLVSSAVSFKE